MKNKVRAGFALCGSYCTFEKAIEQMARLARENYDLYPILSEKSASEDTRFGAAADFRARIEEICGKNAVTTMQEAEALSRTLDVLVIAPCTSATLARLAQGLSDSVVSFCAKGVLRGEKPVVLAVSTNDALGASAPNIGALLTRRGFYFVPFAQDDPEGKPRSALADFSLLPETLELALSGRQLQPILRATC